MSARKVYLSLAVASMLAAPGAFAYNEFNARMDCLNKVVHWGSSYSNPQDVRADETGHHSFNVIGTVRDRDDREHRFDCRIEHKEVVSWNVSSSNSHSDKHKSKTDKALVIGAGIVGLAALAAVIANSKSNDNTHDASRVVYNSGKSNPFDDMRYLRSECRRVVREHLVQDHGAVDDLDLDQANLNGRALSGDGRVSFESGGARNLTYSCNFDRGGNVYDGNYSYRAGR
ncbi:MAG: hypothetical protein V5B32_11110 [Candidatus Accumulibacter sp. UW26]|jgi:hypothetical protein